MRSFSKCVSRKQKLRRWRSLSSRSGVGIGNFDELLECSDMILLS